MSQVAAPKPECFSILFDLLYYHLLYHDRNYTKSSFVINRLREHLHPKPNAHLRASAYTRNWYALQLSGRNCEETESDLSAEDIAAAWPPRHTQLQLRVHDTGDPVLCSPFSKVSDLCISFNHSPQEKSENVVAVRDATETQRPGGKMIIGFLDTEQVIRELVAHELETMERITFHLRRHLDWDSIAKEINSQILDSWEALYKRVRALNPEQAKKYFLMARLWVAEVLGDCHLNFCDEQTSTRISSS